MSKAIRKNSKFFTSRADTVSNLRNSSSLDKLPDRSKAKMVSLANFETEKGGFVDLETLRDIYEYLIREEISEVADE